MVFEFELPFEGGRRPDVVLIAGDTVVVLEFKTNPVVDASQLDQVAAYARDLREYHESSHWRTVVPVLVSTTFAGPTRIAGDVIVCGPAALATTLGDHRGQGIIDFDEWLRAPYAPLPSLVSAARRIFQNEPLPHVRQAVAARIPETVALVDRLTVEAKQGDLRRLIFVTGVPGAGKTLVGLRAVYERTEGKAGSTFLSGNGPLVKVLQDALHSTVFVRDLHKFVSSYGQTDRIPEQQLIVFDEAQRAWDSGYMFQQRGIAHSEPELLLRIGERLPRWASLVGLVGTGQSIFSGEEGGMSLWRDALGRVHTDDWEVFCPPSIEEYFADLEHQSVPELELRVPLRSRQAERFAEWVDLVIAGRLGAAEAIVETLREADFPVYVTRDLGQAKDYAHERYDREPDPRYGLVATSHARNLPRHGVDNSWIATSRINIAKWFNAPPRDPKSCCALTQPITEFQCQGLEVDLPIICWGDDFVWHGDQWVLRPRKRRYTIEDPDELLRNAYRVLLTRGRDGVVIWVPPDDELDETAEAIALAGAVSSFRPDW
ncbi:MAG: DUF2075 domain-containing protein [Actinomycetota bacterium]|nr:DUF2075 domain-containing protein [Actinomycetota bacterium]